MAQRQIPGGPFVLETTTRQLQIPGGPFLIEEGGAADVTLALTGVAGTGAVGSLLANVARGLSGNVGTGGIGTLSVPSTDSAGGMGTAPLGLTPVGLPVDATPSGNNVTLSLSGVAGTAVVGTFDAGTPNGITGVGATGAVGSLRPSIQSFATAATASGIAGPLSTTGGGAGGASLGAVGLGLHAVGLPEGSVSEGVGGDETRALSGNGATGAAGTLVPGVQYVMAGQDVGQAEQGAFVPEMAYGLTGIVSASQVGGVDNPPAIGPAVAVETDTAFGLVLRKLLTITRADEIDTAIAPTFGLPGFNVATAVETDAAFDLLMLKLIAPGVAVETDLALTLTLAGSAAEPDRSYPLAGRTQEYPLAGQTQN